MLHKDPVRTAL